MAIAYTVDQRVWMGIHLCMNYECNIVILYSELCRDIPLSVTSAIFVDFVAGSRYLRQGLVITSSSLLWDVITYPCCLRYLLLVLKTGFVIRHSEINYMTVHYYESFVSKYHLWCILPFYIIINISFAKLPPIFSLFILFCVFRISF